MILIISENDDASTDQVLEWLRYYKIKFLRINNNNFFDFFHLAIDSVGKTSFKLKSKISEINNSKISGYWYRRGRLSLSIDLLKEQKIKGLSVSSNSFLINEANSITELIYNEFHNKTKSIGNINENNTNKLVNLKIAKESGLDIPNTWVITSKIELINLLEIHKRLLTKPITQRGLYFENEEINFDGQSNIVNRKHLKLFPDNFPPTLFQNYIHKAFELRIFYFDGELYASAIFSQLDAMTKVDFRNYNFQKPNRTPPFKLPKFLSDSIKVFMRKIKMKSGSLDVLVSTDKKYYFLEVNPIGQFYQVSYPCNYYLERRIAQYFQND
jgi:ATP-GRASP peptide maturase of grasp-with-spasm system